MMLLHIVICGSFVPILPFSSPPPTINVYGIVSQFWASPLPLHMPPPRQVPHFLWPWVGLRSAEDFSVCILGELS